MILALEIASHLGAEKSAGDGVITVAAQSGGTAGIVDVDEDGAGVGAIESADGFTGERHGYFIVAESCWVCDRARGLY